MNVCNYPNLRTFGINPLPYVCSPNYEQYTFQLHIYEEKTIHKSKCIIFNISEFCIKNKMFWQFQWYYNNSFGNHIHVLIAIQIKLDDHYAPVPLCRIYSRTRTNRPFEFIPIHLNSVLLMRVVSASEYESFEHVQKLCVMPQSHCAASTAEWGRM